jgi:hypothetical protein
MALSMHSTSVPIFVRMFTNMLAWLDAAEAHAKSRGFDPNLYLALRLAPDMLPFSRQVQIASDTAKFCAARLAGLEAPKWTDDEATLDELRARIRKTIDYLKSVPAPQVDGSEGREVSLPLPTGAVKFTGESYLKQFALPNFLFHCTTTYALLRHAGVALGKLDYLGAP